MNHKLFGYTILALIISAGVLTTLIGVLKINKAALYIGLGIAVGSTFVFLISTIIECIIYIIKDNQWKSFNQ